MNAFNMLIISVLANAALVFGGTLLSSSDESRARDILDRQQQASLKSALDHYFSKRLAEGVSVEALPAEYNATTGNRARLGLISDFLDEDFYEHLLEFSTGDQIQSKAMLEKSPPKQIRFSDWPTPSTNSRHSYPKVILTDAPPGRSAYLPTLSQLSALTWLLLLSIWLLSSFAFVVLLLVERISPVGDIASC